MKIKKT
jgi:hypothetical protein